MNIYQHFHLSVEANKTNNIAIINENYYFDKDEKSYNVNSLWQIGLPDPFPNNMLQIEK